MQILHCFFLWKVQWQQHSSNNSIYILFGGEVLSIVYMQLNFSFLTNPQNKSDYLLLGYFHFFLCSQEKGVLHLHIYDLKFFTTVLSKPFSKLFFFSDL